MFFVRPGLNLRPRREERASLMALVLRRLNASWSVDSVWVVLFESTLTVMSVDHRFSRVSTGSDVSVGQV